MPAVVCSGDGDQVAADILQVVASACRCASAVGVGQDLVVDQTLADAPVVVQQVAEVRDVEPDLAGVPAAADAVEHVLGDAQVDPVDDRQEHAVALGVLAAVRAEVAVRVDLAVRTPRPVRRRCSVRAAVTVNGLKFISDVSRGM